MSPSTIIAFGAFVLDEEGGELRRDGRPVAIRPTPLRLLSYLLRHPDRVIPKQELLDRVWPDVSVGDASLSTALKELRQVLGHDGRHPRIQTLRGRGVRFRGPVERLQGERGTAPRPLIGRVAERQVLDRALADARGGSGSIALLIGEPGIGKTRLGARVLERARAEGCRVGMGSCPEQVGSSYAPWVQGLGQLAQGLPEDAARRALGDAAPELARLIGGADVGPVRLSLPGAYAQQRLHQQAAGFLERVAHPNGLVVFLDDLHWCDPDSLALLDAVAASVATSRMLLLCAARDAESTPAVRQTLARLSAIPGQRIELGGLPEEDVGRLAAVLRGGEIDAEERRLLTRRSGGNPFFVTELLRSGDWSGEAPVGVPVRVRDVMESRLSHLSRNARALLEAAAVAGREARTGVVERASGLGAAAFVEALDETLRAGLLSETEAGGIHFPHDLVRDAVMASLPRIRRCRLHDAITEGLAALQASGAAVSYSELAAHAESAVPLGSPVRAVRHLQRAAGEAAQQLAFESAAASYTSALQLADQHAVERRIRAELLLGLGLTHGARGQHGESAAVLRQAAEQARALGDAALLASAGLAHPVGGALAASHTGTVDEALVEILEEAAERLSDEDTPLRVRLLSRLATELYFTSDRERGIRLAAEALGLARRLGDAGAEGDALVAQHYCLWTPENLEPRLSLSREIVDLGRRTRNPVLTFQGLLSLVSDHLERGDMEGVRQGLEVQRRAAEELGLPLYRWAACNTWPSLAIAEGRLADAERLAQEALAAAQGHENPDVVNGFSGQMFMILRERDQLDTLLPIVEDHVARFPEMSVWRRALAFVHGEHQDEARARQQFEILAQGSFAALQEDMFRLFNLVMLAETCSFLGDARRAATLARMVRPYEERNVSVGGLVMAGAGATYLAKLRATEARFDDAERLFELGLAMNERMGARLWHARACLDYARMLLRRPDGAMDRAAELLDAARRTAEELDLAAVARTARELSERLPSFDAAG